MLALRQNSPATADDLNSLDEVTSVLNTSVQSLMLQQAVQARSMRDLRIALSHTHVNPLKWLGMAFLGFLTMISIAMVHVDRSRAELLAILLFAAAAAPTAAIILVHGNPFQEPAAVTAAPIAQDLRKRNTLHVGPACGWTYHLHLDCVRPTAALSHQRYDNVVTLLRAYANVITTCLQHQLDVGVTS